MTNIQRIENAVLDQAGSETEREAIIANAKRGPSPKEILKDVFPDTKPHDKPVTK